MDALKKEIEMASKKRNEVAHGIWMKPKTGGIRLRLLNGERHTDVGPVDRLVIPKAAKRRAGELGKDAAYIHRVTDHVRALERHILAELKAWPKINPARRPRP
jgi:hypothetical protein